MADTNYQITNLQPLQLIQGKPSLYSEDKFRAQALGASTKK